MTDGTDLRHHRAHAGGLAALLQIENSPLALLNAVRSGRSLLAGESHVSLPWYQTRYAAFDCARNSEYSHLLAPMAEEMTWIVYCSDLARSVKTRMLYYPSSLHRLTRQRSMRSGRPLEY